MRTILAKTITKNIKEMCIEANYTLSKDVESAIIQFCDEPTGALDYQTGKKILNQLEKKMNIAKEELIPICQDTGMAVIFINIGQDVHITGMNLEDAINLGIREGYQEGYLRSSIVKDPIERENTNDNTPGVIHYNIVPGENIEIIVAPKGFGSENMSKLYMLKPSDGIEGVKKVIIETVKNAGGNACPPMFVGVGIGGNFEKCTFLSKKALTRDFNKHSDIEYIKELEEELYITLNKLGIGPGGLGGTTTVLGINIETYPTHIAGLPVAINICCHVNRHVKRII